MEAVNIDVLHLDHAFLSNQQGKPTNHAVCELLGFLDKVIERLDKPYLPPINMAPEPAQRASNNPHHDQPSRNLLKGSDLGKRN